MLDVEVLVSPLLELRVVLLVVVVADLLIGAVEVLHVLFLHVHRGDVCPAPKPPQAALGFEVAVVKVHRRAVWVFGVHHRAKPTGEEPDLVSSLELSNRPVLILLELVVGSQQSFGRHSAVHHSQVAARLLPNLPAGHDAGKPAATVRPTPNVFLELSFAIHFFYRIADMKLRFAKHLLHLGAHFRVSPKLCLRRAREEALPTFGAGRCFLWSRNCCPSMCSWSAC
mmetsp:Transcript_47266/g.94748  ORF Transcript_47266/g.94748 Transcript_47266/m.94748 type:complete len:226 (+) Transcript_47266:1152-1829(+)